MAQPQPTTDPEIQDAQDKIRAGQFDEAKTICNRLLEANNNDTAALNVLAIAYAYNGEAMKSAETLSQAVLCEPDNTKYKTNFAKAIERLSTQAATTNKAHEIKQAIQICLEDDRITHRVFSYIWYLLFMQEPRLVALTSSAREGDFQTFCDHIDLEELAASLSDTFLHLGLRRLIAAGGGDYERLMTLLRRYFLCADDYDPQIFLPFLCALAEQCNLNEYVYARTDEETDKIAALETALDTQPSIDTTDIGTMVKIALVGCYKEIDQTNYAANINAAAGQSRNDAFEELVKILITDPIHVRELQAGIPTLSAIKDDISSSVRQQYEDNPYPRWRCMTAPALSDEDRARGCGKTILIAGCGTGQEILNMALHYPEAELITGIDLSLASLAYGKQKAIELGIENVEFMQADILELEQLDRQFDMITCSGVLHHMDDPVQGWKKLLTRLKPDGVLKVALYSEIARQHVTLCREWIKDQGFAATPDGISSFRQAVMAMDDTNPLTKITQAVDFYSMSMCRDLLFHVQEHVFTLPQIKNILNDLDLCLLSLDITQPGIMQKYLAQHPDDPTAINLDNWNEFEQQNSEIFVGMYPFWSHKKDSQNPGQIPTWVFTEKGV